MQSSPPNLQSLLYKESMISNVKSWKFLISFFFSCSLSRINDAFITLVSATQQVKQVVFHSWLGI